MSLFERVAALADDIKGLAEEIAAFEQAATGIAPLLNIEEAATLLGISRSAMSELAAAGTVPAIPLLRGTSGRTSWRFDPESLRDWWRSRETGGSV